MASKKPSQSNCLTIRHRDAPTARRTAISLERAVPRASNMLARFRQAMSNTGLAIDLKSASDEIVTATHPFPKSVTRNHHRDVRFRLAFFSVVKPAPIRLGAHHREIIFRSQKSKTAAHIMIAPDAGNCEFERG